jgi:hypothetical protein
VGNTSSWRNHSYLRCCREVFISQTQQACGSMQDRKLGLVGGIVRAAQLHPLRTVEHCTIVLLVLHLVSGRACQPRGAGPLCPAGKMNA